MFRVYIRATPEAIWQAITTPEWTARYGYHGTADLRPPARRLLPGRGDRRDAGFGMAEVVVDGEVVEVDPPQSAGADLPGSSSCPTRSRRASATVTWDIQAEEGGVTRLTVTHDVTDTPSPSR